MVSWILVLGFLCVSLTSLALFAFVAANVNDGLALTKFDAELAAELHQHAQATPTAVAVFRPITVLGSAAWLTTFAIVGVLLLLRRGHRHVSRVWGLVFAGALLQYGLKAYFQRHRPIFSDPLVLESSWSFPSGHAMGSVIGYGLLAYLLCLLLPRWRLRATVLAFTTLLVLVIGFTRLYLGAHYFSDVVAGYLAGVGWLSGSISGIEWLRGTGRMRFLRDHDAVASAPSPLSDGFEPDVG